MKTLILTALSVFAIGAAAVQASAQVERAQRPDRAAFEAAAQSCGLTKPEKGRRPPKLTDEQKSCMTTAGFPPPEGRGHRPPPPPEFEEDSASSNSRDQGSTRTVQ